MASVIARFPSPPVAPIHGRRQFVGLNRMSAVSTFSGRPTRLIISAKATGESLESSTSSIDFKSIQNAWDKSEDRIGLIGLGLAGIVGLWASVNLIVAVDKLPLIPSVLEFVGILFSSWFVYRYLLFKPDREELFLSVNKSISDILGQ
ncbi:unnamed protein product [Cuscuta campestris]|uniref:Cyanobacterial aminoacyl-tRNA synthetase CAAD domain-containing protein n=2 Tax=Cuscuta sect. Cleistogrammica TaxID=1824901 RepID=A0A484KY14_9ASTE|nr:hypothetical protein DM860_013770 [Cuscuta australis]VFQ67336.1 unnamed protein product [Cuscuta campestris]